MLALVEPLYFSCYKYSVLPQLYSITYLSRNSSVTIIKLRVRYRYRYI